MLHIFITALVTLFMSGDTCCYYFITPPLKPYDNSLIFHNSCHNSLLTQIAAYAISMILAQCALFHRPGAHCMYRKSVHGVVLSCYSISEFTHTAIAMSFLLYSFRWTTILIRCGMIFMRSPCSPAEDHTGKRARCVQFRVKGIRTRSTSGALLELCSPFPNSVFIAAVESGLFPQTGYRSLE